jgi:hypothetical protein
MSVKALRCMHRSVAESETRDYGLGKRSPRCGRITLWPLNGWLQTGRLPSDLGHAVDDGISQCHQLTARSRPAYPPPPRHGAPLSCRSFGFSGCCLYAGLDHGLGQVDENFSPRSPNVRSNRIALRVGDRGRNDVATCAKLAARSMPETLSARSLEERASSGVSAKRSR